MPMPREPFVIYGGCNCHAVRYRVTVPEWSSRARLPWHKPGGDIGDVRIPMSLICHCNDCRRATTALGAHGLVTDMTTVELSVMSRARASGSSRSHRRGDYTNGMNSRSSFDDDHEEDDGDDNIGVGGGSTSAVRDAGSSSAGHDGVGSNSAIHDDAKRRWVPAAALLDAADPSALALRRLWLRRYESSPMRHRFFCGRCGTQIGFCPSRDGGVPAEWGWPRMFDICTGSVDRQLLENADWFRPEHAIFTDFGIGWVREQLMRGLGSMPEHAMYMLDDVLTRPWDSGPENGGGEPHAGADVDVETPLSREKTVGIDGAEVVTEKRSQERLIEWGDDWEVQTVK